METIRYCGDEYEGTFNIYDSKNNEIGRGLKRKSNVFQIYHLLSFKYTFAHDCHKQEFKDCYVDACNHANNGEISLMTIKNYFSKKKLNLVSLNELFIEIDSKNMSNSCLKNTRLESYLFIPCDEKWSDNELYTNIQLFCEICENHFTLKEVLY